MYKNSKWFPWQPSQQMVTAWTILELLQWGENKHCPHRSLPDLGCPGRHLSCFSLPHSSLETTCPGDRGELMGRRSFSVCPDHLVPLVLSCHPCPLPVGFLRVSSGCPTLFIMSPEWSEGLQQLLAGDSVLKPGVLYHVCLSVCTVPSLFRSTDGLHLCPGLQFLGSGSGRARVHS
jgi:hypothetical protein